MTTRNFLAYLAADGTTAGTPIPYYYMKKLHELVGFEDVWAFERKYAQ
jgi:hypothetical protein